ncbi:MAG: hypothetical protein ACJAWL_000120 [Motiliproteus sp.]
MVVFKILSKVSGQNYIGSCRSDIDERWQLYLRAAEAGLDFPLYKEIREHGEEQFIVEELDYADDIAELKEMELLHTVELSARSLRSYKFGITDALVKRIRQGDHERAWMKDLPEEPLRAKIPAAPAAKPKPRAKATKPRVQVASSVAPKPRVVSSKPEPAGNAQGGLSGSRPETDAPSVKAGPVDHSAELDKALFAEGIGLLVRAVAEVDQLSSGQQQARDEAQSLTRALADSDRVLQQLQAQQEEVALKARLAMEAVEASQSANATLIEVHRQTRERSLSALKALESSGDRSIQAAQLQQELSRLLLRIKVGAAGSKTAAVPAAAPAAITAAITAATTAESASAVVASEPAAPSISAVPVPRLTDTPAAEATLQVEAQEAKMVNQLKQLDQMLTQEQPEVAVETASKQTGADTASPSAGSPLEVNSPARAWVGTIADDADSALVLVKDAAPATVVLRRPKVTRPVGGSSAGMSAAADKVRKTLSIKAR